MNGRIRNRQLRVGGAGRWPGATPTGRGRPFTSKYVSAAILSCRAVGGGGLVGGLGVGGRARPATAAVVVLLPAPGRQGRDARQHQPPPGPRHDRLPASTGGR